MNKLSALITAAILLGGCGQDSSSPTPTPSKKSNIVIVTPATAPKPVQLTASDLEKDLNSVLDADVSIISSDSKLPEADQYFVIGQVKSLLKGKVLSAEQLKGIEMAAPEERGGVMQRATLNSKPAVVLSGVGVQGTQYTVYDYSEQVLGVDKMAYWTGKKPALVSWEQLNRFDNSVVQPPVVPYLVYFENDVDELANLKKPYLEYDWESFTNMIDTLVRLRYNGIEMFDMLGRVEFYTRPEYLEMHPDYQFNEAYLNKMLDYIHDKGMLIQIDMIMGRKLGTLSTEASTCWKEYKQDWIDMWTYYMSETPIKKADIIAMRPRNPVWDWEYKSTCGEDKAHVFNEAYAALGKVIDENLPEATKVVTCYHDGMEIFNEDFNPPKDFIVAWSDNGWGGFDYLPKSTKGYKFGTYMHAGFWLNHDVHDPYPEVVDETMTMMYKDFDATSYMMVNGQTFRPFLINIEAFAESARLGTEFDGEQFYLDWAGRYFGQENAQDVVSIMKALHSAHEGKIGYVEILWHVKKMIAYLSNKDLQRPGRDAVPVDYDGVTKFFDMTQPLIDKLNSSLPLVEKVKAKLTGNDAIFFHDYVELPIYIYRDLLEYNQYLIELSIIKGQYEKVPSDELKMKAKEIVASAKAKLAEVYNRRLTGDKDPKWDTWYDPSKRRPNNGFPDDKSAAVIEMAIDSNW